MAGERIAQLNEGLHVYRTELLADDLASQRVEVAVVTFGTGATVLTPFITADCFQPPALTAADKRTSLGEGINLALDLLEQRRQQYRANGVAAFRPWVFLITDGAPTDEWQLAAARVRKGEAAQGFNFFPIGVEGANFDVLRALCVRQPLRLKGLRFRDLFLWVSQSQRSVSRSSRTLDQTAPPLNLSGPDSWASLG
jgi:uncharacterized protein YegL